MSNKKDPQVEYNRSRALMDGATESEINNPNKMAEYHNTGKTEHQRQQAEKRKRGGK